MVILRKGGIIEDKGKFSVDYDQFWLFPTLYHQQMDSVVADARTDMDRLKSFAQPEGSVRIEFFIKVEKAIECTDLGKVLNLRGQHIWKDSVIEERFGWGKNNGIHLIIARVYRLPEPQILPMLPDYGGCKSWVELDRPLSTVTVKPVLSDAEFSTKATAVLGDCS